MNSATQTQAQAAAHVRAAARAVADRAVVGGLLAVVLPRPVPVPSSRPGLPPYQVKRSPELGCPFRVDCTCPDWANRQFQWQRKTGRTKTSCKHMSAALGAGLDKRRAAYVHVPLAEFAFD